MKTGVRQGYVVSPMLVLVVIDLVMKKAASDRPRGIVCGLPTRLEDADFAGDIGLLSHLQNDCMRKHKKFTPQQEQFVLQHTLLSSGVSRSGIRGGVSKSRKYKWLVKVGVSKGFTPLI